MKFDAVHNEIELTDADLQAVHGGDSSGNGVDLGDYGRRGYYGGDGLLGGLLGVLAGVDALNNSNTGSGGVSGDTSSSGGSDGGNNG